MDIYKYKIWTGYIPGVYTEGCNTPECVRAKGKKTVLKSSTTTIEDNKVFEINNNALQGLTTQPTIPNYDCSRCRKSKNYYENCQACLNGYPNECCQNGENCCPDAEQLCEDFWSLDKCKVAEFCKKCENEKWDTKTVEFPFRQKIYNKKYDSNQQRDECACCNRYGRDNMNSSLPIFLDHDFNDMGVYSLWDGDVLQKDSFSNFLLTADTTNPYLISITNTTEFEFFKYLNGVEYFINWGDGNSIALNFPTTTSTNTYINPGNYEVTIQMSAPWGVTSMVKNIVIPSVTSDILWSTIVNTGQTYTWIPVNGGPVASMDYNESEWGPLDSGMGINDYITSNWTTTPYTIQGITQSMLSSFQTYNNTTNSAFLPVGYSEGPSFIVPIGGQIELPDGTISNNLTGWISNATSTYTAYTITNGTEVYDMFDYENGTTLFDVKGFGLNDEDLLTRECGMGIQTSCDLCYGTQSYYINPTYSTQNVIVNKGEWDFDDEYIPGDFVYYDGCCFFVISINSGNEPDKNDNNSSFWRLCQGSCTTPNNLESRYNCVGGVCVAILPSSNYYNTATYVGNPPTTSNAQIECQSNCVPIIGQDIHYECNNGTCLPISPSNMFYNSLFGPNGGTMYSGPTAFLDCDSSCISTNDRHNCENGLCVPSVSGFFADYTTCYSQCSNLPDLDWWCMTDACTSNVQGTGQPVGATNTTPFTTFGDCNINCGNIVLTYRCVCQTNESSPGVTVDSEVNLGSGDYGGQTCQAITDTSNPGPFMDRATCEESCLSWDCSNSDGSCSPKNVSGTIQADGTIPGNFCSDFDITNGGLVMPLLASTIDIKGCEDNCFEPSYHVCIAGVCTFVGVSTNAVTPVNPTQETYTQTQGGFNSTQINYSNAIYYAYAGGSEADCYMSSGAGGGGCSTCDSNPSPAYPLHIYDPGLPNGYQPYDAVITLPAGAATVNQDYKYWYNPAPVCDPGYGLVGLTDCGDPGVINDCEDFNINPTGTHPCTAISTNFGTPILCNNPPYTISPPIFPQQSRLQSQTCWEPCGL